MHELTRVCLPNFFVFTCTPAPVLIFCPVCRLVCLMRQHINSFCSSGMSKACCRAF